MGHATMITPQQAADILGVSDRTIRNMVTSGALRDYRVGPRLIRLRLDDVRNALKPVVT